MNWKLIKRGLCASVALGAIFATIPSAIAQEDDPHLSTERAVTMRGNSLDARANTAAEISGLVDRERGRSNAARIELVLDQTHAGRNGRTHLRMHQEVDGLRVYGSIAKAALNNRGELMHLMERTSATNGPRTSARISESEAIRAAVSHTFVEGAEGGFFHAPPTAERVMIARKSGRLQEGFLVQTWGAADNKLYETLIDGRGRVVTSELRTAEDSYNIFADHPGVSAQTVVPGAGAGNTESPIGWLSGSQTSRVIRGNNVSSYLDRDGNNVIDGGGSVVSDGNFLASHFPVQDPTFAENQDLAVQNLFYLNNLIHDDLYRHGFTETTLNFQEDNFGRGGQGGDSVNAEAQDGSGTNNANFATPSDGTNPRMQMFLWTLTNPGRDGDLDSDIVWHEYGHGLTWRMIGSMSGSVSGAIGEGMSDVLAILHNGRDTVGEYSTNDLNGIWSAPYTNYTRTIDDFSNSSVHFDGEIYAATIWRLSEIANAAGIDNEALLDVVVDGMNFTFPGPDYLDMRDGILAASSSEVGCMVWQAFADFGMGEGASFNIRTGGNPNNRIQITESSSIPASCNDGGGDPPPPSGDVSVTALSGSAVLTGRRNRNWTATASVSVADNAGADASGVEVEGSWSTGANGSCTTDITGSCNVSLGGLRTNRVASVAFTITGLNGGAPSGSPLSLTINRP